jgi:hypothetical protein
MADHVHETARVVEERVCIKISVALAGAIFASDGGATPGRRLATPAQRGMLVADGLSALQLTFSAASARPSLPALYALPWAWGRRSFEAMSDHPHLNQRGSAYETR